ncbi:hypothetical protein APF79_08900 [bacterium BRH_c32]|nr:MAG: hypothetical protein APF79_08900 [bacterium BRH_c32]
MDKGKILKNSPSKGFWIANILGWSIGSIINFITQFIRSNANLESAILAFLPFIFGLIFTTLLRYYWGKIDIYNYSIKKLILVLIPHSLILNFFLILFGIGSIIIIRHILGTETKNILNLFILNYLSTYILILLWIAIYFLVIYYFSMKKKEIDNLQLINSLQSSQLLNLRNQLNPHFLFNALNNIRSLIREDSERARAMIGSLTDTLRYSLRSSKNQKVLLSSEIEFVEEYLKLEHLHMESRLSYKIVIPEDSKNCLIPPMIIQLLAENAIKHGLSKLPDGGELTIEVTKSSNKLNITVINSGNYDSSNPSNPEGVGIKNILNRIDMLYKENSSFSINQIDDSVIAKLILPIEYENESINS